MRFVAHFLFTLIVASSFLEGTRAWAGGEYGNTAAISKGVATNNGAPDPSLPNLTARYRQANDNLTLQALYLQNKIEGIDQAVKAGNDDEALKALGPFCMGSETSGAGLKTCADRYRDFQGLALARMRAAMGSNEDTIARMTSGRKLDGTVQGDLVMVDTGLKPGAYTPDVPTLAELETEYKKSGGLNGLPGAKSDYNKVKADAKKWFQELAIHNPKEKEMKFRAPVAADPRDENRKDEKLVMIDRDSKGEDSNDPDMKAYLLKKANDLDAKLQGVDQSAQINSKSGGINSKTMKRDDKITYEAFTEARKNLIGAVEKTFGEKNAVAQIRGPANVQTKSSLYKKDEYKDTDKIRRPPSNQSSRYIKYDLTKFWETIRDNY